MIQTQIPVSVPMPDAPALQRDIALLELVAENADLRLRLAEAQEQCIEMAVDAGLLQAEIDALRAEIAGLRGTPDPS